MRCAAIACALALAGTAGAQSSGDTSGCPRPTAFVRSCIEVSVMKRPQLMAACVAEIEAAIRDEAAWEACVAQAMAARHEQERRALADRASERRVSLLRNLQAVMQ